eukprot:jgi/Galph1/4709/GphlegSOOS_G3383.1
MTHLRRRVCCFVEESFGGRMVACFLKRLQRREIEPSQQKLLQIRAFRLLKRKGNFALHKAPKVVIQNTRCTIVTSQDMLLSSEEETQRLGGALAKEACVGDVILLYGDFGSGKTTFARSYIRTITNQHSLLVPSPSYLLVNEYEAQIRRDGQLKDLIVYHLDVWRMKDSNSLPLLDFGNILQNGICLIEWPTCILPLLPVERLELHFSFTEQARQVQLCMIGERWQRIQSVLEDAFA